MIKREFKVNLKSFIIWMSILIVMFLLAYLIYPYIITDEVVKNLDDMMKSFPPELMKAFNMDISSITTAYGWFKSEGCMYILIITGIYSSILGSSILLKEESDKTIEYLGSLPIKRSKIMTNKVIVGISYILLMILILALFSFIALIVSGDFNHKEFFLLSITPIFSLVPLFALNLFISTYMHKTKKAIIISFGLVFLFYIINILSELSTRVEFLKYFSIYTLCDTRNIIANNSINPMCILFSIMISILLIILSYIRYDKKELI